MPDASDMDLLRDYDRLGSEDAFATLVQRHINLVYSAALRHVGIAAHAEEITQAVFVILARQAGRLRPDTVLEGWLYETTRLTALRFMRGERRRRFREQEAYMQSTLQETAGAPVWNQLAPLLDEALSRLGKRDRDAVVLRFFKDKSLREVAAKLSVNEVVAQKRVYRAVKKLRQFFARRGVVLSAALLTTAISTHSVQAAPAALAKSVTAMAVTKGAAAGGSTLTLIKGALKIMAWTKAKTVAVTAVAVLLAVGTTTVTLKKAHDRREYAWETTNYDFPAILQKVPPQVHVLPAKYPDYFRGNSAADLGHLGMGVPLQTLIQMAFVVPHQDRIIYPPDAPQGKYDYIANLPHDSTAALQREIEKKLGLTVKPENRETDVLILKLKDPGAPGLKPGTRDQRWTEIQTDAIVDTNLSMSSFAAQLEDYIFFTPILDQTGLTNFFDLHVQLPTSYLDRDAVKKALLDQLGLELVPGRESIEVLVVEKAK